MASFGFGATNSIAQSSGGELTEAVTADAAGEEAFIVLDNVEPFSVHGGRAVFEPGTDYEEAFTYAAVDPSTNRLSGLTRPDPLAHPAGGLVEAAGTFASPAPEEPSNVDESDSTESPPEPTEGSADTNRDLSHEEGEGVVESPSASGDFEAPLPDVPDPCSEVAGNSCSETMAGLIAPVCEGDACLLLDDTCGATDISCGGPDPCASDSDGATCVPYVEPFLENVESLIVSAIDDVGVSRSRCVAYVMDAPRVRCCMTNVVGADIYGKGCFDCEREHVWMNVHVVIEPPGGEPPIALEGFDDDDSSNNTTHVQEDVAVPCVPGLWRLGVYGTASNGAKASAHSDYITVSPVECGGGS